MKEIKISGIYKITNNITGEFYIGSSKDIKQRWARHKSPSRWAKQPNSKLYQDMIHYSLNNFKFEILEETDNLHEREQYWMDKLSPTYNSNRAQGLDENRLRKNQKKYYEGHQKEKCAYGKKYREIHREELLTSKKEYYKSHQEEQQNKMREYYNKLCLYKGETLTLGALCTRFRRWEISHYTLEAKKYLITN